MNSRAKRTGVLALSSLLMVVPFLVITYYDDISKEGIRRMVRVEDEKISRELVENNGNTQQIISSFQDICPEDYPPQHAMLHDDRSDMINEYETFWKGETEFWNRGDDIPEVFTGKNYYFAVWTPETWYETETSAWNATAQAIQSNNITEDDYVHNHKEYENFPHRVGWVDPKTHIKEGDDVVVKEVLEGDWVGFSSWWIGNFGHFVHDHLPTIAFLRSVVPETTKFLLADSKVSRNVIRALDPDFYENRVKWIELDDIYHITGNLHVAVRRNHHMSIGCCTAFDPMRQWIADVKPEVYEKKTVVYYSRSGSKDTHHGRVLQDEAQVIEHIKTKMKEYGLQEELVVFNGRNRRTEKTLPIEVQAEIFRKARTIIGPHGSGLGGNFIWTNPHPKTCAERTQLLEFMPGTDAIEVQHGPWVSYYNTIRKWPLDYHNILYTSKSNFDRTYINLSDLDKALDYMWGGGNPALNSVPK